MIEYVTGETMEIYSAVLFLWLITGLIFLINAICSHTWTDLVESLMLVAVWSVFFAFDIFFPVMIPAVVVMTVWNSFIVWKAIKQKSIPEKLWIRLCIVPVHFLFGAFFVYFWRLTEQI
jgi:hypothetical protein